MPPRPSRASKRSWLGVRDSGQKRKFERCRTQVGHPFRSASHSLEGAPSTPLRESVPSSVALRKDARPLIQRFGRNHYRSSNQPPWGCAVRVRSCLQ
jgi:hypothetical protein